MAGGGNGNIFYASRPVVRVDGQPRPALGAGMVSLVVEETTLGLFRCEARVGNWGPVGRDVGYLYFGRDVLDFGKAFEVELGPPGGSRRVFAGKVTGLEAHYPQERPPELTVLAEDTFQDLRMARRTRSFEDVSDGDVVRRVAAEHALSPDVDLDGPTHRVLTQVNQSDLAFLRERVAAVDGELWVDGTTLHAQARSRRDAGTVVLRYGAGLLEFSVLADLAHQRSSVRVSGWDVGGKEAIDEEAAESAVQGELAGGRSGSAVLAAALGERKERVVASVPLSATEASETAKAQYRWRARQFVRGTGQAEGAAAVRVGSTVDLKDLGPLFSGKYYVTRCRQTFDTARGFRTTFDAERPGIGG